MPGPAAARPVRRDKARRAGKISSTRRAASGDYCAARSAKRELLLRDDARQPEETSWQLLSIGKSRLPHRADADGRPLCERGKWAQTPATVKTRARGERGCQPAECPGPQVGPSPAAKPSTIPALGSQAPIPPPPG